MFDDMERNSAPAVTMLSLPNDSNDHFHLSSSRSLSLSLALFISVRSTFHLAGPVR